MPQPINRRDFLAWLAAGAASACTRAGAAPQRPPNVILILADDLGWAELGCYGNRFNETPRLDALARRGVRFTQGYAAAPVCSPTRASIMTGEYPARVGITDYLRPNDPKHLPLDRVALPEALKARGYATGIIGKWHLTGYESAGVEEFPPGMHGFDEVILSETRGIANGSYFHPYHFNPAIARRLPEREHLVDRCNLEAVEFIERHKEHPFFLYLSHYAVHTALAGRPDLVAHFEAKAGAGKGANAPRNNPHLAAQLKCIDDGVGQIEAKLRELGLLENTLILFLGDNGGEGRVTSNAPLRAGKATLYEGGIRVSLIAAGPGVTQAGRTCETPACTTDLYPTLLELAGAKPDPAAKTDGVSLLPLLRGGKVERDALYWHYPLDRPHFLGGRSAGAVRRGNWKLIELYDTGERELYDLAADLGERRNLAAEQPAKVAELAGLLERWRRDVGAEMPPPPAPPRTEFVLGPGDRLARDQSPQIAGKAFRVEAQIEHAGQDGVLVAQGGPAVGYALYILEGRPVFATRHESHLTTAAGEERLPAGKHTVLATFGKSGAIALTVDGKAAASAKAPGPIPRMPGDGLEVGRDEIQPVGPYAVPFAYGGKIERVVVRIADA